MPMHNGGLTKLQEECGELVQVAAKFVAYPIGPHPDGKGDLRERLEQEVADVRAAIEFVSEKFQLDRHRISDRAFYKRSLFNLWDQED